MDGVIKKRVGKYGMTEGGYAGSVTLRNTGALLLAVSLVAVTLLVSSVWCRANDSIARLAESGPLLMLKSDDIRMLEEVLEISSKKVRVRCRFLNESDKPIRANMAFVFPKLTKIELENEPYPEIENRKFVTRVNGRVVETSPKDHTATWVQEFPPWKVISIEHSYRPLAGGWYSYSGAEKDKSGRWKLTDDLSFHQFSTIGEICLDDKTIRSIERKVLAAARRTGREASLWVTDVEYVLATGRNWKGPIGRFTLRVVKDRPDRFVSLCFPGKPRKVSPTTFEFVHKDFVPPDRVLVTFYEVRDH